MLKNQYINMPGNSLFYTVDCWCNINL